jgi:CRISPR-associated protein (TIGR02584 family)
MGMSPAVLTETVWALANPEDRGVTACIPSRVVVLTTFA